MEEIIIYVLLTETTFIGFSTHLGTLQKLTRRIWLMWVWAVTNSNCSILKNDLSFPASRLKLPFILCPSSAKKYTSGHRLRCLQLTGGKRIIWSIFIKTKSNSSRTGFQILIPKHSGFKVKVSLLLLLNNLDLLEKKVCLLVWNSLAIHGTETDYTFWRKVVNKAFCFVMMTAKKLSVSTAIQFWLAGWWWDRSR